LQKKRKTDRQITIRLNVDAILTTSKRFGSSQLKFLVLSQALTTI